MVRDNFFKKAAFMKNKTLFLGMVTIFMISFAYFSYAWFTQGVLISPEDGSWNNDGNVTFSCSFNISGTNDTIDKVDFYINMSEPWGINTTNGTDIVGAENYTYIFDNISIIPDGHYVWNCLATDNGTEEFWAGVTNYTIKVDATNPSVTITYPSANQNISATTIWVNGTASDNNSDTVIINDTKWGTNNGTYGNWAFKNTSAISDGTYTILITANDSAGNLNDTETVTFTVDNTAPTVSEITSPTNDTWVTSMTISINASDAIDTALDIDVFVNGTSNVTASNNVTEAGTDITLTGLQDNSVYLLILEVTDDAGNKKNS